MALVTWKDEYSVGVASLDNDHKRLLEIVNHLHRQLHDGATAETLARLCDRLIDHSLAHFGREESDFEKTGYRRAAEHRLMHEQLKGRLLQFRKEIAERPPPLGKLVFFSDWLTHHMMGEDRDFGVHLNSLGIY